MDGDGFSPELDTNGDLMGCSGLVLDELEDDAGLSNSSIADDNELEEIVIILNLHNNRN